MPYSLETLGIILVIGFFGMLIATIRNALPYVKSFVDTMVEAVKSLRKFKKKQPIEL